MLLPRFSIRQLMYVMVGFGLVAMILGWSVRGDLFAYGLGLAIVGLFVPIVTFQIFSTFASIAAKFHSRKNFAAASYSTPAGGPNIAPMPTTGAFSTDPFAPQADSLPPDSGTLDSGTPDLGTLDSGTLDSFPPDSNAPEEQEPEQQ